MELTLQRTRLRPTITTGQLYIDGVYFCFTLEDRVREPEGWTKDGGPPVKTWKVQDQTAIPTGVYTVGTVDSPKFGPNTLTLLDVPGFDFIRIHTGNTDKDTDGCIIVGYRVTDDGIIVPGTSRPALADLKTKVVPNGVLVQPCTLRVLNPIS